MNSYKTNIAGKEAIFTDECIKIGNLTLPYEKMSNIKFRNGENKGFIFDYEGRNLFIPCSNEEKNIMMSFFKIVVLKDKERREEEEKRKREEELLKKQQEEQDALNTLDFLSSSIPDNADTIKNDAEEISQNIVNPNSTQAQVANQEPVQQNIQSELPQQPMPQQNNQTHQTEIKPFWKTGRLVMGIISMVLFVLITLQSCAAGLSNAIEESSSISGSAGFLLGLFMLVGGIVGVATRKSVKKGGCIASAILYAIGSLFGALEWNSTFSDLKVWVVVSILFSIFY